METHIQAVDDALIDSLSFKLPNSANFINDRRSVSFFPSGGNSYSPNGVKIIKFVITGSDWLDPSTVRVQFRLNNENADGLKLVNSLPSNFFRRLRIIAGGQVIEDIDCYNRVYNMVHMMLPEERRLNDAAEAFGIGDYDDNIQDDVAEDRVIGFQSLLNTPWVGGGSSRVVLFPLLCGIFNQTKFLPLKYLQGLQIELEVVNNYTDCICTRPIIPNGQVLAPGPVGPTATAATWLISEAQIKCDVVSLDNQLDNEYTKHLLEGKSLPINFSSFVHQVQAVGGTDRPVIAMSRAFTRLKSVYVSFYKRPMVFSAGFLNQTVEATHLPLKECSFFWHPQYFYPGLDLTSHADDVPIRAIGWWSFQYKSEVEAQLQIGSKLFPEMPIRSGAEAYYHLRKALGSHRPNSSYGVNIAEREYRTTKFVLAFDCEKQTNVGFTGINTRSGDLITVKVSNLQHVINNGTVIPDTYADFMHTTLEYDAILSITDAGVTILE